MPAPRTSPPPDRDRIILVVEDHPVNRILLQRQVALLGYRCELAANGSEAIDKLTDHRYDLVLTDCHMPHKDGYQLTREIRAREAAAGMRGMPIIACTANALSSDAALCFDAGMDDYLPKPITLQSLEEKIRRWLDSPGTQAGTAMPAAIHPTSEAAALDPGVLEPYVRGDRQLREDILGQFLQEHASDLDALDRAHEAGEADLVARAAHRIKGAARMIGAAPLAAVSEHLENLARGGQLGAVPELRQTLQRETDRLAGIIRPSTQGSP
jgi:CheY-like chemotaxis protein/HPt (histidine-containing phosphotransfer) domain-containing protein